MALLIEKKEPEEQVEEDADAGFDD